MLAFRDSKSAVQNVIRKTTFDSIDTQELYDSPTASSPASTIPPLSASSPTPSSSASTVEPLPTPYSVVQSSVAQTSPQTYSTAIEKEGIILNTSNLAALYGATSGPTIDVLVSHPVRTFKALAEVLTFQIRTETDMKSFPSRRVFVRRSISDFETLRHILRERYSFMIVPPLPQKFAIEKMGIVSIDEELLERRRVRLQRFLSRVVEHPVLCQSLEVINFLKDEPGWQVYAQEVYKQLKLQKDDLNSAGLSGFMDRLQAVRKNLSSSDSEDVEIARFRDIESDGARFERQLFVIHECFVKFCKKHQEIGGAFREIAPILSIVADSEIQLKSSFAQMAQTLAQLSAYYHEQAREDEESFLERLKEYIFLYQSMMDVIQNRSKILAQYAVAKERSTQLLAEEATLQQAKLNPAQKTGALSLFGKFMSDNSTKLEKVRDALAQAQTFANAKKQQLEILNEGFAREWSLFNRWKVRDFKLLLTEFVEKKLIFHQRAINCWRSLKETVDSIEDPLGYPSPKSSPETNSAIHLKDNGSYISNRSDSFGNFEDENFDVGDMNLNDDQGDYPAASPILKIRAAYNNQLSDSDSLDPVVTMRPISRDGLDEVDF